MRLLDTHFDGYLAAATLPALSFEPELLLRAQGPASGTGLGMRAAIFDVDGVLTDGRLFIGEQGEVFKAFHVLDGHGLKLLCQAGIAVVIITGRDSPALRRRIADLGLEQYAHYGVADKLERAQQVLDGLGLGWGEVAAIGDDWPDLPLLARVGLACAPPNAHAEVRALVHHVTAAAAGAGAAREFCDLLLMASGKYGDLLRADLRHADLRHADLQRGDMPGGDPQPGDLQRGDMPGGDTGPSRMTLGVTLDAR